MDAQERQNAIDTAIENGQYVAAPLIREASMALSEIERVRESGPGEMFRLRRVIDRSMPAQNDEARRILSGEEVPQPLPALCLKLRDGARAARAMGGSNEGRVLDLLAAQIDEESQNPKIRPALDLRSRISAVLNAQSNKEIRRWFEGALIPGNPIVTNTGERIA